MWKQLFHQIWNQRRANSWLWVELSIVTVLLWYGIDLAYNFEGAARQPKGYDTDDVFELSVQTKPASQLDPADRQRAGEDFTYLYNLIKEYPGVEEVCAYYGSVPYSDASMVEGYASHADSARTVHAYIRYVSASYFRVFRLKPLAGQLDEAHWNAAEYPVPVLMSEDLADSLYHPRTPSEALGQTCFNPYYLQKEEHLETNYRVQAVLPRHKLDDYERYEPFIYQPATPQYWQAVAIRVSPRHAAGFAERFRRDMQPVFDRGAFYLGDIRSYADMKAAYDIGQGTVNYLNTVYAVAAFFLFNVFLCVLATFWYRTRKRRCEIALRMAMGSSRRAVMCHLLGEGGMLLLVAAVPALFVAFNMQVADLTVHTLVDASWGRFAACFVGAVFVLAVVIALGVWYPARQAMRIRPAEALHDE